MKVKHLLSAAALSVAMAVGVVNADTTIRVQSVLSDTADEVFMLKEFRQRRLRTYRWFTDHRSTACRRRCWPSRHHGCS